VTVSAVVPSAFLAVTTVGWPVVGSWVVIFSVLAVEPVRPVMVVLADWVRPSSR
jgi:hypothetical protein